MRKLFFISCILLINLYNSSLANYTDSGWIKFKQPDGITFIGRISGDEFEF
jgi:hypothetical protein